MWKWIIWQGRKYLAGGQTQNELDPFKMIGTYLLDQNDINSPKSFWTHRRKRHRYIISSYPIFVVGILNLCENLSCFLFHRQHRNWNQIKKRNLIFIKERQFFPHLYLIIDSSHFKFIHLPLILATLIWIWMISLGTASPI